MITQRLRWARPDGEELATLTMPGGSAIIAKTRRGDWLLFLVPGKGFCMIGPRYVARHAGQRWAERALATGRYDGCTVCPLEGESYPWTEA
jgi:hypothetical protein